VENPDKSQLGQSNLGNTVTQDEPPHSELTKEKDLFGLYLQTRKLPTSLFNQLVTILTFLLIFIFLIATKRPINVVVADIRIIAESGFGFATSILGFLIAGYTILTTLNKPNMFKLMANIPHSPSNLSLLKYNFLTFVDVFIRYLCFVAICVFIKIFCFSGGPAKFYFDLLNIILDSATLLRFKQYLLYFIFTCIGSWFINLVAILASFIFNVYYIAMTSIRIDLITEPNNIQ
jgi:hypothetical protein